MYTIRLFTVVLLGLVVSVALPAHAAFLFEVDTDGTVAGNTVAYNPNFSFGGDTTTASVSGTSTAFGTTGGNSIFGGDGVLSADTYVSVYSPDSEADNLVVPAGQDLGDGNTGTGVVGGGADTYSVYVTWPITSNVSGAPTNFDVQTSGDAFQSVLDPNAAGAGSGHEWILLGQINYTSGPITVTQTATSNTFVSQRLHGYLFEVVPEPASAGLILLGAAGLAIVRRRRSKTGTH